jgi:signal peptidase II
MRWLWLSIAVIAIDRWTKALASAGLAYGEPVPLLPCLNLTLVHNTGAAFSLLRDAGGWQRWFFIGLGVAISAVLVAWLRRLDDGHRWLAISIALVLGGAIGNLWDRIALGYVVDFIDVYAGRWHWPAFNAADSAIFVGAVMLAVDAFWLEPRRRPRN